MRVVAGSDGFSLEVELDMVSDSETSDIIEVQVSRIHNQFAKVCALILLWGVLDEDIYNLYKNLVVRLKAQGSVTMSVTYFPARLMS